MLPTVYIPLQHPSAQYSSLTQADTQCPWPLSGSSVSACKRDYCKSKKPNCKRLIKRRPVYLLNLVLSSQIFALNFSITHNRLHLPAGSEPVARTLAAGSEPVAAARLRGLWRHAAPATPPGYMGRWVRERVSCVGAQPMSDCHATRVGSTSSQARS